MTNAESQEVELRITVYELGGGAGWGRAVGKREKANEKEGEDEHEGGRGRSSSAVPFSGNRTTAEEQRGRPSVFVPTCLRCGIQPFGDAGFLGVGGVGAEFEPPGGFGF